MANDGEIIRNYHGLWWIIWWKACFAGSLLAIIAAIATNNTNNTVKITAIQWLTMQQVRMWKQQNKWSNELSYRLLVAGAMASAPFWEHKRMTNHHGCEIVDQLDVWHSPALQLFLRHSSSVSRVKIVPVSKKTMNSYLEVVSLSMVLSLVHCDLSCRNLPTLPCLASSSSHGAKWFHVISMGSVGVVSSPVMGPHCCCLMKAVPRHLLAPASTASHASEICAPEWRWCS